MNFFIFLIIVILTYLISITGLSQIIGIIKYKLLSKQFNYIFSIIIWLGILIGYYFIILRFFYKYFYVYLTVTIISFILSLGVKNE